MPAALLHVLDRLAVAIFVVEILAKLYVYRWRFFASGWNLFDFVIVAAALVPAGREVAVLRALRILRALRLISVGAEDATGRAGAVLARSRRWGR